MLQPCVSTYIWTIKHWSQFRQEPSLTGRQKTEWCAQKYPQQQIHVFFNKSLKDVKLEQKCG